MLPSLESSDEEDEQVEIRSPSIEELKDMKVVTRRKKRFERKGVESRVALSSSYGCGGDCNCGKEVGQHDEKW
eukprot:10910233-Karenia_brevis.AAC.1